jgi:hypothetical protein
MMKLLVGAALLFVSSCDIRNLDSGLTADKAFPASYSMLRSRVFEPRCSRCHVAFLSYKRVMEMVVAGDSSGSALYTEVQSDGMPENGHKLIDAEKNAIKRWIELGANND